MKQETWAGDIASIALIEIFIRGIQFLDSNPSRTTGINSLEEETAVGVTGNWYLV
jgi:hypothetical protein